MDISGCFYHSGCVLAVYRAILRQGRLQLRLTDQRFFKMVREEFQKRNSEEVTFRWK